MVLFNNRVHKLVLIKKKILKNENIIFCYVYLIIVSRKSICYINFVYFILFHLIGKLSTSIIDIISLSNNTIYQITQRINNEIS